MALQIELSKVPLFARERMNFSEGKQSADLPYGQSAGVKYLVTRQIWTEVRMLLYAQLQEQALQTP